MSVSINFYFMNYNLNNEVATASLSDTGSVKAVEQVKAATSNTGDRTKPSRKKVKPVYAVLRLARKQFGMQIKAAQNTETKISCIVENIPRHYGDAGKFWIDLKNEANDLLDSVRFNKTCDEMQLNAEYVSEHIIFEGKTIKREVLDKGVQCLGDMVYMFYKPLFVDKAKMYGKEDAEKVQENPQE